MEYMLTYDCLEQLAKTQKSLRENVQAFSDAQAKLNDCATQCSEQLLKMHAFVETLKNFLISDPKGAEIYEKMLKVF